VGEDIAGSSLPSAITMTLGKLETNLWEEDNESFKKAFVNVVKFPKLLVVALDELEDFVGCEDVKLSIIDQIQFLIISYTMISNTHSTLSGVPPPLYDFIPRHTLITGAPGSGKTTLAQILAKIWASLGVLEPTTKLPEKKHKKPFDYGETSPSRVSSNYFKSIISVSKKIHDEGIHSAEDVKFFVDTILTLATRALESMPISSAEESSENDFDDGTLPLPPLRISGKQQVRMIPVRIITPPEEPKINISSVVDDSPNFVIAGREDFVSLYQGQTTEKTRKFLSDNEGKVIIIEEAYTLCTGDNDSYGMELLTLINRHMTEKPHANVFIFCGYHHLITKNLFSFQPGLRRRFRWGFKMQKYSAVSLYEIFIKQIERSGWKVDSSELKDIKAIFEKNIDYFPASGGDTQNLVNSILVETTRDMFEALVVSSSDRLKMENTLTLKNILAGFDTYKKTIDGPNRDVDDEGDDDELMCSLAGGTVNLRKLKQTRESRAYARNAMYS